VDFPYTATAFTISPEPRASLCCAHSAGSEHPEQSRRVLTYPETWPYMLFLFPSTSSGQALAHRFALGLPFLRQTSFRHCLTTMPLPLASTFANVIKPLTGFTYRGLTPHKFTPPDKFGIFDTSGVYQLFNPHSALES